jgi:hypothetical protein
MKQTFFLLSRIRVTQKEKIFWRTATRTAEATAAMAERDSEREAAATSSLPSLP